MIINDRAHTIARPISIIPIIIGVAMVVDGTMPFLRHMISFRMAIIIATQMIVIIMIEAMNIALCIGALFVNIVSIISKIARNMASALNIIIILST